MHEDVSGMMAADGVKITFISAGRFKTEANPFEPITAEAISHHQEQVDATYRQFVDDVSRGRGVAKSVVRDGFGQGRMYHADQAAELGLVDRVAGLGKVLGEMGATAVAPPTQAEAREIEDELCHAWETGEVAQLRQFPHISVQAERLALQMSLDRLAP